MCPNGKIEFGLFLDGAAAATTNGCKLIIVLLDQNECLYSASLLVSSFQLIVLQTFSHINIWFIYSPKNHIALNVYFQKNYHLIVRSAWIPTILSIFSSPRKKP